jgi:hypothetical protein
MRKRKSSRRAHFLAVHLFATLRLVNSDQEQRSTRVCTKNFVRKSRNDNEVVMHVPGVTEKSRAKCFSHDEFDLLFVRRREAGSSGRVHALVALNVKLVLVLEVSR